MRYYLDTSVWLDFIERNRDFHREAVECIERIIIRGDTIIYSDIISKELKHLGYLNAVLVMKKCGPIKKAHVSKKQLDNGASIAIKRDIPKNDARHAIVARDNDAVLLSRDRDFLLLRDIVETKLPEDA